MLELLTSEADPPHGLFQHVADVLAKKPHYLSDLTRTELEEELLSLLALGNKTRHLSRLFLLLGGAPATTKKLYSSHITSLIQELAKPISDNSSQDRSGYHDMLHAAMTLCGPNAHRWKFIKAIAACDQALEVLCASFKVHPILQGWSQAFNADGLDVAVLEDWVRRLVVLVEVCANQHEASATLAIWQKIETLKDALRAVVSDNEGEGNRESLARGSRVRVQEPKFDNDISAIVIELGLAIPRSYRLCENLLESLCYKETLTVLREILNSFPCSLCQEFLDNGVALPDNRSAQGQEDFGSSVFDDPFNTGSNGIGEWTVSLSSRAYQNLRRSEDTSMKKTVEGYLLDLAAGTAKSALVKVKKDKPIIPLWSIRCPPDTLILWQIDVAPGPRPHLEQQIIRVWAIGPSRMISAMINEITTYQKTLAETTVVRCLEKDHLPKCWDQEGNSLAPKPHTGLDIRLVDQEFIDTFNKSFTVTEALLQSVIHQDLTAEFPFDLSPTEMQIIQHFKTPSLILGRSGTGKTTCLVFKMIAKYLTSCRLSPQKPVKQVRLAATMV